MLGGLGLLLGALGPAVASCLAASGSAAANWPCCAGLPALSPGWAVLAENSYLLALGLGLGTAAAPLGFALLDLAGARAASVVSPCGLTCPGPGRRAGGGQLAGAVSTLRAPLLPALRRE